MGDSGRPFSAPLDSKLLGFPLRASERKGPPSNSTVAISAQLQYANTHGAARGRTISMPPTQVGPNIAAYNNPYNSRRFSQQRSPSRSMMPDVQSGGAATGQSQVQAPSNTPLQPARPRSTSGILPKESNTSLAASGVGLSPLNRLSKTPKVELEGIEGEIQGRVPSHADDLSSYGIYVVDSTSTPGKLYMMRSAEARDASQDRINLSRRRLLSIPVLKGEESLKLLNLQGNMIAKIDHLSSLRSLIFLDLYNNHIKDIENLDQVPGLRVLMLGKNQIRRIENMHSVKYLDVLDLHSNQIEKIENLGHLKDLRILNLAGNLLRRVTNIEQMTSLVEINLRRNLIENVSGIQYLPNLQRLYLSSNQLKIVEDLAPIFEVTRLSELSLDGNPVTLGDDYPSFVLKRLQNLKQLDGKILTIAERIRIAGLEHGQESEVQNQWLKSLGIETETDPQKSTWRNYEFSSLVSENSRPRNTEDLVPGTSQDAVVSQSLASSGSGVMEDRKGVSSDLLEPEVQKGFSSPDAVENIKLTSEGLVVRNVNFDDFTRMIPRLIRKVGKVSSIHLYNNQFRYIHQVDALLPLEVRELSTMHNPISNSSIFESYLVFRIPTLAKLNNKEITSQDRKTAEGVFASLQAVWNGVESLSSEVSPPIPKVNSQENIDLSGPVRPSPRDIDTCNQLVRRAVIQTVEAEGAREVVLSQWSQRVQEFVRAEVAETQKSVEDQRLRWIAFSQSTDADAALAPPRTAK